MSTKYLSYLGVPIPLLTKKIKNSYRSDELMNLSENGRVIVSYLDKVYDVTDFIDSHPGGHDKILLAKGKALEPFWNIYQQHTNKSYVVDEILKKYEIGTLTDYDPNKYSNLESPYLRPLYLYSFW